MNYMNANSFLPIHSNVDTWFNSFANFKVGDPVGRDVATAFPYANVNEVEGGFELQLAVPGLHKDAVTIEIEENKLLVSAENREESQNVQKYIRKEFDYKNFKRAFILNDDINKENIKAEYRDGILIIRLPKVVEIKQQAQKIDIT